MVMRVKNVMRYYHHKTVHLNGKDDNVLAIQKSLSIPALKDEKGGFRAMMQHMRHFPWNLMVNEDKDNPSWSAFLIDLDLAIKTQQDDSSGAQGKTGPRMFMAIGVLYGEKHCFMHDLESFFWVLFWICIHYESPGKGSTVERFEK
ncbi:hypothetical protein PAAG_06033 [Paracoccidioides lutzii Pb01]|uniref:Fungal-type protein kinase domain-containing protein n=1 Tax=Paracoccidioides lutzii (strain ATCC MYA-826 / Pb01) TaxID=502779 RepID=C1H5J2_PARBA|nr:hypothetical protein PAAG_06033 [Paracoccidioides lutzii Pb01]EEH34986.2 hypothetical protein PAAG_06033 [Paracoccidioides lutzii Pb01]